MKPRITDTMSSDLITIGWTESMDNAFRKMRGWSIRHLPVTDDSGEIIGILSDRDVQRAMRSNVQRDETTLTENVEFADNATVRDYMNWPVISVESASDLRTTAGRMIKDKVSSVLITNKGKIVGIITAEDLLKVLISLLDDAGETARWSLSELLDRASNKLERYAI